MCLWTIISIVLLKWVTCTQVTRTQVTCTQVTCTQVTCTQVTCTQVTCTQVTRTQVTCTQVTCTLILVFWSWSFTGFWLYKKKSFYRCICLFCMMVIALWNKTCSIYLFNWFMYFVLPARKKGGHDAVLVQNQPLLWVGGTVPRDARCHSVHPSRGY